MFRCILFFQDSSDRRDPADIFFQARDHFVVRKGHELNDESAGSADSVLFVHEHTKSHSGRNLLRLGVVSCQVLGNLTCHQRNLADIGILEVHIPDYGEGALSHSPADIEVSLGIGRKDDMGILDISFDMTVVVRRDQQALHGAVSVDLDGEQIMGSFEHFSHHQSA